MKTSIFDMNFTLPPMIEMTEVEKELPAHSAVSFKACSPYCWAIPFGE